MANKEISRTPFSDLGVILEYMYTDPSTLDKLRRIANHQVLQGYQDAEDRLHDGIVSVLEHESQNPGSISQRSNPESYIGKSVKNKFLDSIRRNKYYQRYHTSFEVFLAETGDSHEFTDSRETQEHMLLRKEMRSTLKKALEEAQKIYPEETKWFLLQNVLDIPVREIAEIIGMSEQRLRRRSGYVKNLLAQLPQIQELHEKTR